MKIIKNYFYNTIFQFFQIVLPLLTTPYISRVLGPSGVGINSYTNSVVNAFILLGTLGFNIYGQQAIAINRDDQEILPKVFWGIFFSRTILLFLSLLFYLIFVFFFLNNKKYFVFFLAQSVTYLSVILDNSWFFIGIENFKKVVIRNIVIKISLLIFMFIFVRNPQDTLSYINLLNIISALSSLTLWYKFPLIKKISFSFFERHDFLNNVFQAAKLFLPELAVQTYLVGNKIILGYDKGSVQAGLFENSSKIITMILTLVTSIGTVTLPNLTKSYAKKRQKDFFQIIDNSFTFLNSLSVPMCFGLVLTSSEVANIFFGSSFSDSNLLLIILSPVFIFNSWSTITGYQFLLSTKQVGKYTFSTVASAILSFVSCLLLVPKLGAIGAAISLLLAEFSISILQIILTFKDIDYFPVFIDFLKYFISAAISFALTYAVISILNFQNNFVIIIDFILFPAIYFLFISIFRAKGIVQFKKILFRKIRD